MIKLKMEEDYLKEFSKDIKEKIEKDWDIVFIIGKPCHSGMSAMALKLAKQLE